MGTRWIDFRALKSEVSIRDVLERYGVLDSLNEKKPGKLVGPCPVHNGSNGSSFHVDVERGIWNCFSDCKSQGKSGGNVLDLVMRLDGCTIREAGERLCDWFELAYSRDARPSDSANLSGNRRPAAAAAHSSRTDSANPPLKRPLAGLQPDHEYIRTRGLSIETAKHFGIGFANRGMMRGRIAIPIHDDSGELVAYAGRAVDDELAREKGKYRLPNGFKKSLVVWNLHRADSDELIVVEGFFGAIHVHQAGFEDVVALMGSTISDEQADLLCERERLVLMLDGDDAGREGERECYRKLRTRVFLRSVHLADGEQPDDLSGDRLRELLS